MPCLCAAGVIDSQQQQLQLAAQAHQELVRLVAQQGTPPALLLTHHTPHHHKSCQPLRLPGQCSQAGCSCRIPSDSTVSSSTCSDSSLAGSLLGSCNSTANLGTGCSASGPDWAVTVQPPRPLGTHVRVTVSKHSGKLAAGCQDSTECSLLSCSGLGSSAVSGAQPELCHSQADCVYVQASEAGPGLPSVAGHRSSCYQGMCVNRAPGAPLLEGSM